MLSHQTNKHFVLKLISFNSGQYQISGQLQNNTVHGALSIAINRAIIVVIYGYLERED